MVPLFPSSLVVPIHTGRTFHRWVHKRKNGGRGESRLPIYWAVQSVVLARRLRSAHFGSEQRVVFSWRNLISSPHWSTDSDFTLAGGAKFANDTRLGHFTECPCYEDSARQEHFHLHTSTITIHIHRYHPSSCIPSHNLTPL